MKKPAVSLAPMEGITTYIYRRLAAESFTAPHRFFTPYLSPAAERLFSDREMTEILPEHNHGLCVIPQLMVNRSDLAVSAICHLKDLGYSEANLNMGCPSGNVTRKKKGAGMLADPEALDVFLTETLEKSPLPLSIKTRIGLHSPEEFEPLLHVFSHHPVKELILHPRVRDQFYRGELYLDLFRLALEVLPYPVIFNGDITDPNRLPESCCTDEVMIGRGLIARPDLLEASPASAHRIREFYRKLEEEYLRLLPEEGSVLVKMKRLATYRLNAVPHTREQAVALLSAPDLETFHRLDFTTLNFYNEYNPMFPEE